MENPHRAIFGFSQTELLFLISSRQLFPAFLASMTVDKEEVLFSWRKVDVVEQSRLPQPCTDPSAHVGRHTDTLPTGSFRSASVSIQPRGGKKKQAGYIPRPMVFLNLACSRVSRPLAGCPIRLDRRGSEGRKGNPAPVQASSGKKENQESNGDA